MKAVYCKKMKHIINLRMSSSLKGLESAISSDGTVKPVKEKDKPKLALEARLRAAPLLNSSNSIIFIWALLDFLMWVLFLLLLPPPPPLLRPGDAPIINRLLDFLDKAPPLSDVPGAVSLCEFGDLKAAARVSASWSDFVRAKAVELIGFSMEETTTRALPKV